MACTPASVLPEPCISYFFSCHFSPIPTAAFLNGLLCISLNLPSAVSAAIVLQYHFIIYHVFSPFILQQYNTFSAFRHILYGINIVRVSICQTFLICKKPQTEGQLKIHVTTERGFFPIKDASIRLSLYGEILLKLLKNYQLTFPVRLQQLNCRLPLEYSMEPSEFQPYSEYTIQVNASGYRPINISGISVLPDKTSIQNVRMETATIENPLERNIVITANTLYGNFPPKIPEDENQTDD